MIQKQSIPAAERFPVSFALRRQGRELQGIGGEFRLENARPRKRRHRDG